MGVQSFSAEQFKLEASFARNHSPLWKAVELTERTASAALLLLILPALLIAAIIVIFASRRSPLIAHRRVGQNGREIWVFKLRTMWNRDAKQFRLKPFIEPITCGPLKLKPRSDPRVTSRFAALCRKYSIDECPQLWHVVTGDMSLVGPRPLTASELADYYGQKRAYLLRAKPGITGLWQIKGRSRLSYDQRRRLDIFLLQHWSFSLYAFVLAATIPRVLSGQDAW